MNTAPPGPSPRNGVLLLAGYAIRIYVERGHLCVEDGVGTQRRAARFPRPSPDLSRVVVLGRSGMITFDALSWLYEIGVSFVQIDPDGRVITAAGPIGLQDARIRRAQAQAVENGRGVAIARELAREKLAGQRTLLDYLPEGSEAAASVESALARLDGVRTIEEVRALESEGASAYWKAWARVEVHFARRDVRKVPKHWRTFGRRASLLTGNPRKATNPANAVLNYLYAIVEAEARLAALAVGCDPAMGLFHADQRARNSLACDLMEPVRPTVDAWVLDLLRTRTFRRPDFFETRQGVCRVMPPLTQLLAETGPRWAAALAPVAEWLPRQLLAEGSPRTARGRRAAARQLATPLTQANRSRGRGKVRRKRQRRSPAQGAAFPRTCVVCGADLGRGARRYCPECRPAQAREAVGAAHASLRKRRAAGKDPAHGGQAARSRGQRTGAALRANVAWEQANPGVPDPGRFRSEILPKLAEVPLADLVRATGLSRPYCAMIRRGARVPHPRHWNTLATLPTLKTLD